MKLGDCQNVLNALTDVTRLRILNLLNEGELCVCDAVTVLREPQPKVSRHLAYLRRSGLVEARKEGLWVIYRLTKPTAKIAQGLIAALKTGFSDCEECKKDLAELKKVKRRSACR